MMFRRLALTLVAVTILLALVALASYPAGSDETPTASLNPGGVSWFLDTDGDGYGDPRAVFVSSEARTGFITNLLD